MPTTLMQLRRLVRSRLGIPISDDFMQDPVVDDHINLAVETIEAEYRWPWSEVVEQVTVTVAAPDVVLAADWRATRALFDAEHELSFVAPGDLLSWFDDTGTPPKVWCPIDDVLVVRPRVQGDTVLTHYWYRQPAWLRGDNDVPAIPDQFAGAIVAKAAELLSTRESDKASSTSHGAEYQQWLGRMRRDVRRSTGPTRPRVRPGGWI
jgi:hypothetical protein